MGNRVSSSCSSARGAQLNRSASLEMCSASRLSIVALTTLAATILASGCANSDAKLKMEPHSVAARLGEPQCRVSVPLTQAEALGLARSWGDPNPEARPEWAKIVAELRPGDQLRMVDCVRAKHNFYFAHIRGDAIITKMYTMILD